MMMARNRVQSVQEHAFVIYRRYMRRAAFYLTLCAKDKSPAMLKTIDFTKF